MQNNAAVPEEIDQHIDIAVLHAGGGFKFRERLRKDRLFLIGCIIVALSLFLAVFGPHIAPYDPTSATPEIAEPPPALSEWPRLFLGTLPLPPPPAPPQLGIWAVLHEVRSEYAQIMSCIFLLISGPGPWSLDALLLSGGKKRDGSVAPTAGRSPLPGRRPEAERESEPRRVVNR